MLAPDSGLHYYEKSANSLVLRLEKCLKNTEAIKRQSGDLSTKIDHVPERVKDNLKMEESLNTLTPVFAALYKKLEQTKKEAQENMVDTQEWIQQGFNSIQKHLGLVCSPKSGKKNLARSESKDRILKRDKEAVENAENKPQFISRKAEEAQPGRQEMDESHIDFGNPFSVFNLMVRDMRLKRDNGLQLRPSSENFKLGDLQVSVNIVKNYFNVNSPRIGNNTTLIGLKDDTSYLIVTEKSGCVLVEKGSEVFAKNLKPPQSYLYDIIYPSP